MKLEDQVVSLQLAQKLKELGFEQKSLFSWADTTGQGVFDKLQYEGDESCERYDFISAYSVAELGEIISKNCREWAQGWNNSGCFWHFEFGPSGSGLMIEGIGDRFDALVAESEADARAFLLIHLRENNLL